ncbi:hypothetical protein BJV78DRAFT_379913 [Lactifluus subvellereus]|nr:hypothetical protein BJV78DRAFT_379913 [Lactifluus subvellereus]
MQGCHRCRPNDDSDHRTHVNGRFRSAGRRARTRRYAFSRGSGLTMRAQRWSLVLVLKCSRTRTFLSLSVLPMCSLKVNRFTVLPFEQLVVLDLTFALSRRAELNAISSPQLFHSRLFFCSSLWHTLTNSLRPTSSPRQPFRCSIDDIYG